MKNRADPSNHLASFVDYLCFVACVSHAFASVHCYLVVTCWERANLFALVGDVYCIFITFPYVAPWVRCGT